MSTPENVDALEVHPSGAPPDDLPAVLDAARASMLELVSRTPLPPSAVRVTVGPVTLEMDWPDAEAPSPPVGTGFPAGNRTGRREASAAPEAPTAEDAGPDHIHAPSVGIFYRAPEPGTKPFVSENDEVVPGQQIGIVEAMKLMIPVESDRHGTIASFLQPNGALVEYGDPLCTLVPADGR